MFPVVLTEFSDRGRIFSLRNLPCPLIGLKMKYPKASLIDNTKG